MVPDGMHYLATAQAGQALLALYPADQNSYSTCSLKV